MIASAVELARAVGPSGVVLREVARRTGVAPAAAYRHFGAREDLLAEVAAAARAELDAAMGEELARSGAGDAPGDVLRSLVHGYVGFALAEPGLFRSAFLGAAPTAGMQRWAPSVSMTSSGPYTRLVGSLEELAGAGDLHEGLDVRQAALDVWAAVHGFAELLLGPQRFLTAEDRDTALSGLVEFAVRGVSRD